MLFMLIAYTKNANDDSNEFQVRKNERFEQYCK